MAVLADNLSFDYRAARAVVGVSFTAMRGSCLALFGPNGAGKTTTLEMLQGYRRPAGGVARVMGMDPLGEASRVRPLIGVMLQEGGTYPSLKVVETVRLFASYYGDPIRADEAMRVAKVDHLGARRVRSLSGGEKQRVSFALALVGRPQVLFLDEPGAGLDPESRAGVWAEISRLKEGGTTVLLATHMFEEAEAVADEIAIMSAGALVAKGSLDSLTAAPGHAEFTTDVPIDPSEIERMLSGSAVTSVRATQYVLDFPAQSDPIPAIHSACAKVGGRVLSLRSGRRSLEEVYLAAIRSSGSREAS